MNKYKIVFIDIDGTLRNDLKEITQTTKDVFTTLKKMGVIIVITSGRPTDFAVEISKASNASNYVISSNGADIYDYNSNENLFCNNMNKKSCVELYNISMKYRARFVMNALNKRVVSFLKYFDGSEMLLREPIQEFVKKNNVSQCVISSSSIKVIKKIKDEIEEIDDIEIKNQSKSLIDNSIKLKGSAFIDVSNPTTSKGLSASKLLKYLNIDSENAVAIGDDLNDISMFKEVGCSVAMGNALDEVKKNASYVTNDNNNEGVTSALIKMFNLKE